jgi:hypothetical protein
MLIRDMQPREGVGAREEGYEMAHALEWEALVDPSETRNNE